MRLGTTRRSGWASGGALRTEETPERSDAMPARRTPEPSLRTHTAGGRLRQAGLEVGPCLALLGFGLLAPGWNRRALDFGVEGGERDARRLGDTAHS